MYDTTVYVADEVRRPQIEASAGVETIDIDPNQTGYAPTFAQQRRDGLVEFRLGNIAPNVSVAVEVKACMFCARHSDNSLVVEFPLDVCALTTSPCCLMNRIQGEFAFKFDCSSAGERIKSVTCSSGNSIYDENTHVLSITSKENDLKSVSIVIEYVEPLNDSLNIGGR